MMLSIIDLASARTVSPGFCAPWVSMRALEAFAQPHFTLAAEARAQAPPQTVTPRFA